MITQDLGIATAYGYAKSKGYTGTEAEFAELMASYASVAQSAAASATAAAGSATSAASSASTASAAASTATTKASEASTSATNAAGSASSAASSASAASGSATSAAASATTASGKASEATTAATTATTAKTDAVTAKTAAETAQTAAETAQGKAETAQEAAEDAAESVSASAAQIATNTSDISDLKEDFEYNTPLKYWISGTYLQSGAESANDKRVRTTLAVGKGIGVIGAKTLNDYEFALLGYDSTNTYQGMLCTDGTYKTSGGTVKWLTDYNFNANWTYKLVIRDFTGQNVLSVNDAVNCLFKVNYNPERTDFSSTAFNNGSAIVARETQYNFGLVTTSLLLKATDFIMLSAAFNTLTVKMPTYEQFTNFGLVFYDYAKTPIKGHQFIYGHAGVETRQLIIPKNAKFFRTCYWSDTSVYGDFVCYQSNNDRHIKAIVAASDSSSLDKTIADFICTGVNDEVVIQDAITNYSEVVLCDGNYYIDSFPYESPSGQYNAIVFGKTLDPYQTFKQVNTFIHGIGKGSTRKVNSPNKLVNGAILNVSANCYNNLNSNTQYAIFSAVTYNNERIYPNASIAIENISFVLPDNQKKIICIDGWQMANLSLKQICATAIYNVDTSTTSGSITPELLHIPVEGCIGVKGLQGSNFGMGNVWESCFVWGFYEGYAISGEHLVCIDLGARFCNYGFTFNRHEQTISGGQWLHPITLINCCDECDFNLPVFGDGYRVERPAETNGRQSIYVIDYNIELLSEYFALGGDYATETTEGSVYGEITYTGQKVYSEGKNNVDLKFWEDGHGKNVSTKNMAHAQSGTTSERLTYTPNYMQQYYDTDLNKLLIYDGTSWIDVLGNIIS